MNDWQINFTWGKQKQMYITGPHTLNMEARSVWWLWEDWPLRISDSDLSCWFLWTKHEITSPHPGSTHTHTQTDRQTDRQTHTRRLYMHTHWYADKYITQALTTFRQYCVLSFPGSGPLTLSWESDSYEVCPLRSINVHYSYWLVSTPALARGTVVANDSMAACIQNWHHDSSARPNPKG